MKTLKFFLFTGLLLAFVATGAAGYVWFKLQNFSGSTTPESEEQDVEFVASDDTPIANTVPEEGIQIDTNAISTEQKEIIQQVGIDLDSVVITQEMVSCAEKKLGSSRVEEILNGATPTALESLTLLGCV